VTQISLYIDDAVFGRLNAAARLKKRSVSEYVSKLISERFSRDSGSTHEQADVYTARQEALYHKICEANANSDVDEQTKRARNVEIMESLFGCIPDDGMTAEEIRHERIMARYERNN